MTVDAVIKWMRIIISEQPSRCFVIFGGDVNDYAGIPSPDYVADVQNPVGPLFPAQEHYCMYTLRGYMEDLGCVSSTHTLGGCDVLW
eukprot:5228890-Pyramimonas_sp.AAC.1